VQIPAPAGETRAGEPLFKAMNRYLHDNGIKVSTDTIVDATIISVPSSRVASRRSASIL
jgi:hypothetical protein